MHNHSWMCFCQFSLPFDYCGSVDWNGGCSLQTSSLVSANRWSPLLGGLLSGCGCIVRIMGNAQI